MKKRKQTPYLDLYYKICDIGSLPEYGLCCTIESVLCEAERDLFTEFFRPNFKQMNFYKSPVLYWGADDRSLYLTGFSETRQNMLLLMAAINDEL